MRDDSIVMNAAGRSAKRAFDIIVSLAGLVVLFPVMVLVSMAVGLTSRGPVFYRQKRIGRHARPFLCVKFRTMTVGAASQGSVTTSADRRITAVGRVLRKLKLDELPQLWNVLTGTMSFVGPRPDVPGYADRLEGDARRILQLRPGITGPATLYFRNEEQLLSGVDDPKLYNDTVIWPKKVELNLAYLDNWSFWRDLGYIFHTLVPLKKRTTEDTENTVADHW